MTTATRSTPEAAQAPGPGHGGAAEQVHEAVDAPHVEDPGQDLAQGEVRPHEQAIVESVHAVGVQEQTRERTVGPTDALDAIG